MRRKRKRKHLSITFFFIIVIFMTVVSFGYSYLSLVLRIGGQITGQMNEQDYIIVAGSNPNLAVNVSKINTWQENGLYQYQYSLKITNVGSTTLDNFKLTIDFMNRLENVSIWNYEYSVSGKTLTVINDTQILSSGQSTTVDFIVSSKFQNQIIKAIKLEVVTNTNVVTLEQFNVNFNIASGWGQYTYQYNVTLTNKTGSKVSAWEVKITLPNGSTYVSGWSAIYSYTGNILTISNEQYNGKLNNNASVTIGLQLSTNIINFIPTDIKITVR